MMRCEVFTDPLYNGEMFAEFDPDDVVAIEERAMRLLLRPSQTVTQITLRNGDRFLLAGAQEARIRAAQTAPREAQEA
jgi:hypothetical protein